MRHEDITLRITRLTKTELFALGSNVHAKMRGNAAFPEPPVSMEEMDTLIKRFSSLISLARNGSRQALFQRNACASEVRRMLERQANYVRMCSSGNALLLVSSGFPLRKIPQPSGAPVGTPTIKARMGHTEGEIKVRWAPVPGAVWYTVYTKPLGTDQDWTVLGKTTRVSLSLKGAATGSRHCFQVLATGTAGTGLMSDMAIGMAA